MDSATAGGPKPPDNANAATHDLEWDPPHGLSSARRWTCRRCGHAVLSYGSNVYGTATHAPCETAPGKVRDKVLVLDLYPGQQRIGIVRYLTREGFEAERETNGFVFVYWPQSGRETRLRGGSIRRHDSAKVRRGYREVRSWDDVAEHAPGAVKHLRTFVALTDAVPEARP